MQSRFQSNDDLGRVHQQAQSRIVDIFPAALKCLVNGQFVVERQVHKKFSTPFVRQEIQTVANLTCCQKCYIVVMNMFELFFVSFILCVPSTNQSYTNIPYLVIGLIKVYLLSIGRKSPSKNTAVHNKKLFKNILSMIGLGICLLIVILKVSLLLSSIVKQKFEYLQNDELHQFYNQFGFRYSINKSENPIFYKISWVKTMLPEMLNIFCFSFYLILIKIFFQSSSSIQEIQRTLIRQIPIQKRLLSTTKHLFKRTSEVNSKSKGGIPIDQKSFTTTIKVTEEKIQENVFQHPYYNQQIHKIFYLLVFLMVLDISTYQTAVNLLFSVFIIILQVFWIQQKGAFLQLIKTIPCFVIILVTQIILIPQILLIYILNIGKIKNGFNWAHPSSFLKALQVLGILVKSHEKDGELSSAMVYHVVLASIIITLSSYYIQLFDIKSEEPSALNSQSQSNESQSKRPVEGDVAAPKPPVQNLQEGLTGEKPFRRYVSSATPSKNVIQTPLLPQVHPETEEANKFDFPGSNGVARSEIQQSNKQSLKNSRQTQIIGKAEEQKSMKSSVEHPKTAQKAWVLEASDSKNSKKKSEQTDFLNDDQESLEHSSLRLAVFSYFLLWICRLTSLIYIYTYHDWQSVFILLWLSHSLTLNQIIYFKTITAKFYLPILIIIYFWYYTVNLNGLFTDLFEKIDEGIVESPGGKKYYNYLRNGFARFEVPFLEVLFMQFNQYCFFSWIKSCENLSPSDDNFELQGVTLMKMLSGQKSNIIHNLILMTFPCYETVLLVIILVSGLNKIDLYHVLYLFIFVAFIIWPSKRYIMTPIIVLYAILFLLMKYIWSMYCEKELFQYFIFEILGISSDLRVGTEYFRIYKRFGYKFWPQQWAVLLFSYLQFLLIRLFKDQDELNKCRSIALIKLWERFPKIQKISSNLYILKRTISLIFTIFLFLLMTMRNRSLVNWGYQIVVNMMLYAEISFKYIDKQNQKKKYWQIMVVYSSFLILSNITAMFLQFVYSKLPEEQKKISFLSAIKEHLPHWIFQGDRLQAVIGLSKYDPAQDMDLYMDFAPHLAYLCFSIYVLREQSKWNENDRQLDEDIQSKIQIQEGAEGECVLLSSEENNEYENPEIFKQKQKSRHESPIDDESINSHRSLIDRPALSHPLILDEYNELQGLLWRIRFRGMYLSYKLKFYWPLLDSIAQYNHMVVYFVVLLLNLFWWFNLINILQISTLIYFNIILGQRILKKKTDWQEWSSKLSEATEAQCKNKDAVFASKMSSIKCIQVKNGKLALEDNETKCIRISELTILQQKSEFKREIKNIITNMRLKVWNFHYIVLTLAFVLIFPSEHLLYFREVSNGLAARYKEAPDQKSQYEFYKGLANILISTVYYMFLAGVQYAPAICKDRAGGTRPEAVDNTYSYQIYGYFIILFFCLQERVLLQWLQNRFHCTNKVYLKIKALEKRILQIEKHLQANESKEEEKKNGSKTDEKMQNERRKLEADADHQSPELIRQNILISNGITAVQEVDEEHKSILEIQDQEESSEQNFRGLQKREDPLLLPEHQEKLAVDEGPAKQENQNYNSSPSVKKVNEEKKILRDELLKRLLVDTNLQISKGFKTILEDLVVLMVLTSSVMKMNLQSFFDFGLVILFYYKRSHKTIFFIMNAISLLWFARLVVILSNMFQFVNPMPYPYEVAACIFEKSADNCNINQAIPLIGAVGGFAKHELHYIAWAFWGLLIIFEEQLYVLIFDFFTIFIVYVYYQTSQYQLLFEDFEVLISKETEDLIITYINFKLKEEKELKDVERIQNQMLDPKEDQSVHNLDDQQSNKSLNKFNTTKVDPREDKQPQKSQNRFQQIAHKKMDDHGTANPFSKFTKQEVEQTFERPFNLSKTQTQDRYSEKSHQNEIKNTIYEILSYSKRYNFYKFMERFAILYYPKVMVFLIISLAIMSNTVFSLGYIVLLSLMMFSSKLFLNFNKARETLKPILQKIIIPYILIEVLAQITFQIPCFRDLAGTGSKAIPQIIGLTEYYTVEVGEGKVPALRKTKGLFQLWLKALVYFLVSIYIQIIESNCFNKLEQFLTLGKMKGQAVTYLFNNLKIKQYQKYQESNFKREQMMLSVKEKCDRWRDIFENQARQDEQKLGLQHNSNRQVNNEQELEDTSNKHGQKEKILSSDLQKPDQNNFGLKIQAQPQVGQSIHEDYNDTKESQISEFERKKEQKVGGVQGSQKAQAKENLIGNTNNEKNNQHRPQRIFYQNKQVQSKDERTLYSEMNFEFLVVKKLDEMKKQQSIKALEEQEALLKSNSTSVKKQNVDFYTIDQDLKQKGEGSIYYDLYKYKLKRLNCFVLLYLKLRTSIVNPVLLLNNKKRVQTMLDNVKKGETITRSSIENAIITDMQSEVNTGLPTNEEVSKRINASRMISKMSFLFLLVVWTNLDIVTYLFMISYFAFVCPGLATVIYPLSIFGFGILYETGPPKMYWHFIMGYTQLLIFIEFSLSLAWSIQIQLGGVGSAWLGLIIETLNSYQEYTGIYLVDSAGPLPKGPKPIGATELWMHFAPKITITCLVMLLIQNEIALDIFEQKEPQKEKVEEAYIRYIKGQYNVEIKALQGQSQNKSIFKNLTQEFDEWIAYYMQGKPADDFNVRYYQNDDLDQQALDMREIYRQIDKNIKYQSEYIYNGKIMGESNSANTETGKKYQALKNKNIQKTNQSRKKAYNLLRNCLVNNDFMQTLFPSIKIQKPGQDFYQEIVVVQVIMCLYIMLFYQSMDQSNISIVDQSNNKQFSTEMLFILLIQIAVMIIDRYIYKSKSFREMGADQQAANMKNVLNLQGQIEAFESKEIQPEVSVKNSLKAFQLGQEQQINKSYFGHAKKSLNSKKSDKCFSGNSSRNGFDAQSCQFRSKGSKQNKTIFMNLEQILARTHINFKSVMKFYFQWIVLLTWHLLLFLWLPLQRKTADGKTFEASITIAIFYALCCLYFFFSAMQIKKGLPEEMKTYFMMGKYNSFNRAVFNVFMHIPFIFELRVFIDWICTKTSLDVYQWIKLSQCQVDLFKAKSTGDYYFNRKLGEKIPKLWKYSIGSSLVLVIIVLLLGPLFLFSSLFNKLGDLNPVSKVEVHLNLRITAPPEVIDINVFRASSFYKKLDRIGIEQFNRMRFNLHDRTNVFDQDMTQYIIMNQGQELWLVSDVQKNQAVDYLPSPQPPGNASALVPAGVTEIAFILSFDFQRASPVSARNPLAEQRFTIYSSLAPNASEGYNFTALSTAFANSTNAAAYCRPFKEAGNSSAAVLDIRVGPDASRRGYQSVFSLGLSSNVAIIDGDPIWQKGLALKYNPCDKYPLWSLEQTGSPAEAEAFNARDPISKQISLFILSTKINPISSGYSVTTLYITFVYAFSKLFRSAFVPSTAQIQITDARDPKDLLMLCETIYIYRMKEKLKEEEELYFLLIDIMRSPVIFKAICGDSIKASKSPQSQKRNKSDSHEESGEGSADNPKKEEKKQEDRNQVLFHKPRNWRNINQLDKELSLRNRFPKAAESIGEVSRQDLSQYERQEEAQKYPTSFIAIKDTLKAPKREDSRSGQKGILDDSDQEEEKKFKDGEILPLKKHDSSRIEKVKQE